MLDASSADDRVSGTVASGYEAVVETFIEGINDTDKNGAALSIWCEGEEVVDIWVGVADARSGHRWDSDTLNVLFSSSKGLAAVVLARLGDTGRLDLHAPVCDLWPEFAAQGKGTVSVSDVLAHRAGVSAPKTDITLDEVLDSARWADRIAQQEPLWKPGSGHAYHALTFGPILQELVRRATGEELHTIFAREIAQPLQADATLKANRQDIARVAHLTTSSSWATATTTAPAAVDEWIGRALTLGGAFPRSLVRGEEGFNDPRVQLAGLTGAGGLGTASALARIWSAVITSTNGIRLLSDSAVTQLRQSRSEGPWVFDPGPPYHRWGAGVQLSSDVTPWITTETFGHDGAGGQSGIADPQRGLAIGYVRNHMDLADPVAPIIDVLQAIIDKGTRARSRPVSGKG